jgi:PAS domain-containing protein
MNPFTSVAVCFILATLGWTIFLLPEVREGRARFLFSAVGLVAVFHGLRLLTSSGMKELEIVAAYQGAVDLLVATFTFVAVLILRAETVRHRITRVQLRLSQAMEPPTPLRDGKTVSQVLDSKKAHQERDSALPPQVALHQLMHASPMAIVSFDQSGNVCDCNAAAERLYGVDSGTLLGKPLPPSSPPALRPDHKLRAAEAHP